MGIAGMLEGHLAWKYEGGHLNLKFKEQAGSRVCRQKGQLSKGLEEAVWADLRAATASVSLG